MLLQPLHLFQFTIVPLILFNALVPCFFFLLFFLIDLTSSCSYGEPIVGNIVNRVRQRKQSGSNQPTKTLDRLAICLVRAKNCTGQQQNNLLMANCERQNQQTESIASGSTGTEEELIPPNGFKQDTNNLIEMCRKWRDFSRKTRETTDQCEKT